MKAKIKHFLFIFFIIFCANIFADLAQIGECKVEQENPSTSLDFFIYPNELDSHYLANYLATKTGTLISVGTFRTLFDVAMGNFSRAIMIDNDSVINDFNITNLSLIKSLGETHWTAEKQRLIYIAILISRQFSPHEIDTIINNFSSASTSTKIAQIISLLKNRPLFFKDSSADLSAWHSSLLHIMIKLTQFSPDTRRDNIYVIEDLNDANIEMTYWKSDRAWQKVQNLIIDNKISVVSGDISGAQTLKSISHCLGLLPQHEWVSFLDVSNALDYFSHDVAKMGSFIANIEALNKSQDFTILTTLKTVKNTGTWRYFILHQGVLSQWPSIKNQIAQSWIFPAPETGVSSIQHNRYLFEFFPTPK